MTRGPFYSPPNPRAPVPLGGTGAAHTTLAEQDTVFPHTPICIFDTGPNLSLQERAFALADRNRSRALELSFLNINAT